MNVNLTPVSDASKGATSSPQSVEASEDAKQSEGFFSKLTSLIKGESGEEKASDVESKKIAQLVEGKDGIKASFDQEVSDSDDVSIEDESQLGEVVASDAKSASTDELLKSETNQDTQADKGDAELSTKQQAAQQPEGDADKIVSENEELLSRLNEANRALKPQNGNELPQSSESSAQVAGPFQQKQEKLHQETQVDSVTPFLSAQYQDEELTDANVSAASNSNKIEVELTDEQQVMVPESVKPFIQSEAQLKEDVVAADNHSGSAMIASTGDTAAMAQPKGDKTTLTNPEIEQLKHELKIQGLSDKEIELVVESAKAEVHRQTLSQRSEVVGPAVEKGLSSNSSLSMASANEADIAIDPTVAANTVAPVTGIPWGAAAAEAGKDELPMQPDAKPKAQLAQSVQQALHSPSNLSTAAQNNLQVASQAAAIPLTNDLAASQFQQVAATPVASEQAMLKAVMGAKAAGSLGKLVGSEGKQSADQGNETGFAQQLSQAAGQQGLTAQHQMRADQATAQAPMQLNREMAGDQVAERVQMMMSKNLKNIDIRLDPPELGRLQIRMSMTGEGATVHFTVANQQARDVIEHSMPRLREMLAQQGVQLGDSSVQQQSSGQQQNRYAAGNGAGNGQGNSNQTFAGEENLEPDVNLDLNVTTKRDGISYYA
ncbi:flagellar hook-length control protein FliK [Vibrio neptunius]|uniref:Flagellar hook-length control protein FliK n=1 Tax=Vibrio neptunius TaxID=170651 RepID=A0ABS3A4I4_9VIBR|nr:flagellar hook-length control protein FliK [Vibrio neptunius]MBN3491597.1 flagellar hook-length control protein FliK [Vibrio neptunius]MBN3514222.1 flagellar hook-length control protein FliK [Vibrio neptunius]MBN3551168.1 flagellar hook-length control protein FliK [Vibrio neptunius]MBN3579298.1 flagellar hook-length control protein FliK [Vibrio neptunius]MCH9872962.1 flagellar hook-length control protein FliK [Vibrio neptunius]